MDITPKDQTETKALGLGQRITVALGIVVTAAGTLLAAVGGLDWITANLPLLGSGLGGIVVSGITAYIAVRRMRVDKLAGKAGLLLLLLLPLFLLSGCVAIRADSDDKGAGVWAFGLGADSSAKLANVAVTGPATNAQTGVSFDSASGDQQSYQAIRSLVQLGAALAPLMAGGAPAAAAVAATAAATSDAAETDAAPAEEPAAIAYSTDGYNGTPGAAGEGVYGRPSCARCRAYKAAHPDVPIINLDEGAHRSDMWAALRLRGYTGGSAALPVLVTADAYTLSAK